MMAFSNRRQGNVLRVNCAWEVFVVFPARHYRKKCSGLVNERLYSESAVMAAIRTRSPYNPS
jgi:hypothetical protein